jgi:exodeoxyribonuclease V
MIAAPDAIRPTAEQGRALESLLAGIRAGNPVQTLGGYAGTGKTSLIRLLRAELRGWAVCAFTGKAASVLRRKGVDASTIHSLIYEPWEDPLTGDVKFLLREAIPHAGIIVDEASMVGRELYQDLGSFGLPLIYVGDHGQLEPVGSADFNLMADPDHRLETVHRNAGEIDRFAQWLRIGHPARKFPRESTGRVEFLSRREIEDRSLWHRADSIICAFNKTRVGANNLVRERLGHAGPLPGVGERVMCLRNARELGLYNGMQGVVTGVRREDSRTRIDFESAGQSYRSVPVLPEQFGMERTIPREPGDRGGPIPFDFAYCITCHKAQGDEFGSVLVLEQRCSAWEHKRWAYTAASRARDKVFWVGGF